MGKLTPGMGGLGLMRHLRGGGCRWPIIVMTGHGDVPTAAGAMREGAFFIEKPFDDGALLGAVRAALAVPDGARPGAAEAVGRFADLSQREREVMDLLVHGKPNKVIAHELGICYRAIEAHRARMMACLGVSSLAEVVKLFVRAEMAAGEPGGAAAALGGF
jgi:two-component system response regulator FixJ